MSRVEEVGEHSIQIEIDEARALIEQIRFVEQHFFEWHQFVFELREHLLSFRAPFVDATAAKFSLFVPKETKLVRCRHHLAPINVVQFKADIFNLALDVSPQDGLNTVK